MNHLPEFYDKAAGDAAFAGYMSTVESSNNDVPKTENFSHTFTNMNHKGKKTNGRVPHEYQSTDEVQRHWV
jgi:hypothetical protein